MLAWSNSIILVVFTECCLYLSSSLCEVVATKVEDQVPECLAVVYLTANFALKLCHHISLTLV